MTDKKAYSISFWWFSFKKIDRIFKVIFFASLAAVLNYECRLITRSSEAAWLVGLNTVLVQVVYSYITGFVFYFLIEVLQKNKRRVVTSRLIHNNIFRINHYSKTLIAEICLAHKVDVNTMITLERFAELCDATNVYDTYIDPYFFPHMSIKEFILTACNDIQGSVAGIFNQGDIFESDWINYLSNIDNACWRIKETLYVIGKVTILPMCSQEIWKLYQESERLWKAHSQDFTTINNFRFNVEGSYLDNNSKFHFTGKV